MSDLFNTISNLTDDRILTDVITAARVRKDELRRARKSGPQTTLPVRGMADTDEDWLQQVGAYLDSIPASERSSQAVAKSAIELHGKLMKIKDSCDQAHVPYPKSFKLITERLMHEVFGLKAGG